MGITTSKTEKEKVTSVTVVLDRSGSMAPMQHETIGEFNKFLEQQKKLPGKCLLTLIQFDTEYELLYDGDIRDCKPLTDKVYVPRGMTALFDATNKAIAGAEMVKADNKIVAVITDGAENSSREVTMDVLAERIKRHEGKNGWEFIFLGTKMEDWDRQTKGLFQRAGVKGSKYYAAGGQSVGSNIGTLSNYTTTTRSTGTAPDTLAGSLVTDDAPDSALFEETVTIDTVDSD